MTGKRKVLGEVSYADLLSEGFDVFEKLMQIVKLASIVTEQSLVLLKIGQERLEDLDGLFASLEGYFPIFGLRVDRTIFEVIVYQFHLLL
jgi:hypothetical protein